MCHPVCLFLLGLFPNSGMYLVSVSVCSRRFIAKHFEKMTVFWLTLCCAVVRNIKTCYPHLIPSFLVSIMTRGLSRKAGLAGRRANLGFNLHCLSQRRLKFKPRCVAMAANATDQTPEVLFYSGTIDIRVQKRPSLQRRIGKEKGRHHSCGGPRQI